MSVQQLDNIMKQLALSDEPDDNRVLDKFVLYTMARGIQKERQSKGGVIFVIFTDPKNR
jgi:hypothetical protein